MNLNQLGVPFTDYYKAPQVDTMILQLLGTGGAMEVEDALLSFQMDTDLNVREYSYVVVPKNGRHALIRRYAHRSPNGYYTSKPVDDGVAISEYVDRIVVDSVRTNPGLSADQLRITLYMSRMTSQGVLHKYQLTLTTAMRSTVDPEYAATIDNWLGVPGEYPVIP